MADVSLADLIARARLESGLRNNAYYDSDQIIRYLDAGGSELSDIFTQANQHYVISTFDFTTAGIADAIVTLPDDFQQGHSLEAFPDVPGQTRTIRFLPNWLNRNAFAGNVFPLSPGGYYPGYTFLGNELRFYPPQSTPAAPFRLYYTPKWTTLAAKITRTFAAITTDTPLGSVGPLALPGWSTSNGAYSTAEGDVGAVLTPSLAAPNAAWNVPFTITGIVSSTVVNVTPDPTLIGSYTLPSVGTFSLVYQPFGTRDTLPSIYAPWSEYLVVYAAIAINTDRQRGTGELERKLNALKGRIASTISERQEEVIQPPLTRGGWDGGWGGGFGGGWY